MKKPKPRLAARRRNIVLRPGDQARITLLLTAMQQEANHEIELSETDIIRQALAEAVKSRGLEPNLAAPAKVRP